MSANKIGRGDEEADTQKEDRVRAQAEGPVYESGREASGGTSPVDTLNSGLRRCVSVVDAAWSGVPRDGSSHKAAPASAMFSSSVGRS